jgi:WD40 repeat protein/energy-coupling factor transporter ATP-binding protein EcfA2
MNVSQESTYQELIDQSSKGFYFYRTALSTNFALKIRGNSFVAVTGKPGVGKSSLVKEEIAPLLEGKGGEKPINGRFGNQWKVVHTYPGQSPIDQLAEALFSSLERKDLQDLTKIKSLLRSGSQGLVKAYRDYIEPQLRGERPHNLLISFDQIEDIFRYKQLFADKKANSVLMREDVLFFNLILNAIQEKVGIYFMFLIDILYLDDFNNYRGWTSLINANRFYVPHMTYKEIEDQIPDAPPSMGKRTFAKDAKELFEKEDPFAVSKIRVGLSLLAQKAEELSEKEAGHTSPEIALPEKPGPDPLEAFYTEKIDRLQGAMNYYAEEIFRRLSPDSEPIICERMFRALAIYNSAESGVAYRKPLLEKELTKICLRDFQTESALNIEVKYTSGSTEKIASTPPEEAFDLDMVIEKYNAGDFKVFHRIDPAPETPAAASFIHDTIIDINDRALINNWERLRNWILLETRNVSIYLKLIEDSHQYYFNPSVPTSSIPVTSDSAEARKPLTFIEKSIRKPKWLLVRILYPRYYQLDLEKTRKEKEFERLSSQGGAQLYRDGILESTREFWEIARPNEAWAGQYFPLEMEETESGKRSFSSTWEMGKTFLEESLREQKSWKTLNDNYLKANLTFFKRLNILVGITLVACLVALILAIWQGEMAKQSRKNIQLHTFVDVMSQTQVIFDNPRDPEKEENVNINQLKDAIVENRNIKKPEDVLMLLERHHFLDLPGDDIFDNSGFTQQYRTTQKEAILSVWDLYEILKTSDRKRKEALKERIDSIKKIAAHAVPSGDTPSEKQQDFLQQPYLYHGLKEHLDTIESDNYFLRHSSFVSTFSSNPKRENQFSFGDINGEVIVYYSMEIEKDKPIKMQSPGKGITKIRYSSDGNLLYVGTKDGMLYQYNNMLEIPGFELPEPIPVYKADDEIIFIERTPNPNILVVVTQYDLSVLLRRANGTFKRIDRFELGKEIPVLRVVNSTDNGSLFFLGGKNKTLIIPIEGTKIIKDQMQKIVHPKVTITAIGISQKGKIPAEGANDRIIALGSEDGFVWMFWPLSSFLKDSEIHLKKECGIDYHESAVTGLLFNPDFPQMASSSLDGSIRLWNLNYVSHTGDVLEANGFDNVRLEDKKQGVWNICYINEDKLVATENDNIKIWNTNLNALINNLETETNHYFNAQ